MIEHLLGYFKLCIFLPMKKLLYLSGTSPTHLSAFSEFVSQNIDHYVLNLRTPQTYLKSFSTFSHFLLDPDRIHLALPCSLQPYHSTFSLHLLLSFWAPRYIRTFSFIIRTDCLSTPHLLKCPTSFTITTVCYLLDRNGHGNQWWKGCQLLFLCCFCTLLRSENRNHTKASAKG